MNLGALQVMHQPMRAGMPSPVHPSGGIGMQFPTAPPMQFPSTVPQQPMGGIHPVWGGQGPVANPFQQQGPMSFGAPQGGINLSALGGAQTGQPSNLMQLLQLHQMMGQASPLRPIQPAY